MLKALKAVEEDLGRDEVGQVRATEKSGYGRKRVWWNIDPRRYRSPFSRPAKRLICKILFDAFIKRIGRRSSVWKCVQRTARTERDVQSYRARFYEDWCMRDLISYSKRMRSRGGNDNDWERLSKARHVKPFDVRLLPPGCWRKRTTFPRFPANFVKNGAYDRKISSRLVRLAR